MQCFKGGNINKSELQFMRQLKRLFGLAVNLSYQKHLSPTSSIFFTLKPWVYFALEVGQHTLRSKKQKPVFS